MERYWAPYYLFIHMHAKKAFLIKFWFYISCTVKKLCYLKKQITFDNQDNLLYNVACQTKQDLNEKYNIYVNKNKAWALFTNNEFQLHNSLVTQLHSDFCEALEMPKLIIICKKVRNRILQLWSHILCMPLSEAMGTYV